MTRWLIRIWIVLIFAYAASGVAVIPQDEVGVVRRFGAVLAEAWQPGLHWGLPWPFDQIDRIKIGRTRTLEIGPGGPESAPLSSAPRTTDDALTGDLNLVSVQAMIQYRVRDPVAYLFGVEAVEPALKVAAETAITRALASHSIDDILTIGRSELAEEITWEIQARADDLRFGVSIRSVRLGRVAPPAAVAPAFADAARARSDRRQAVTAAHEYEDRARADAAGQVREIADRAAARHDRAIALAKGESDRFRKVLAEARAEPDAVRRRLYLETLGAILPRFARKVVVPAGQGVDLGIFEDSVEGSPDEANGGAPR